MKSNDGWLKSGIVTCRLRVTDNIRLCKYGIVGTFNSIIGSTFRL